MKKYLWSLIFTFVISNSSYACEWVGNSWVVRNTSYHFMTAKSKTKCASRFDLKATGGRLNYKSVDLIEASSDGTVLIEIKKNGDSDYTLYYTPQASGEHEMTYIIRQVETNGNQFDMSYVVKLKVDMKFKDPGSLD